MAWLKIQKHAYLDNETQLFYKIQNFLISASGHKFWEVIFGSRGKL